MTETELCLSDRWWRLHNLYSCREEGKGRAKVFVPRPEQDIVFRHLIDEPEVPAYIIKSRRLGLSTGIGTFQADGAVFESGWRGVIIDEDQDAADKKLVEIVRFAVDNLDPAILRTIRFDKRNDSELRLRVGDEPQAKDSVIFADTTHRGGDCNFLHVSEWGPIAAKDSKRSNEIRSGAFPAARAGRRVVETTWMGGKGGDLWEMIKPILERNPNAEGRIFFFPWHDDPVSVKTTGEVTAEVEQYFRELAGKLSKGFSAEQKKWWAAKKLEQGKFMNREYPSTLEEAFRSPVEGALFAERVDQARADGRVQHFAWNPEKLVHTCWDIGSLKNTRVTYWQFVNGWINCIDHDDGSIEMGPTERVSHMLAKPYSYGGHILPHDAGAQEFGGRSAQQLLMDAGLKGTIILRRCRDVWTGFNHLYQLLPRMKFHAERCERLLEALENWHTKKSNIDGHITDVVVPGWFCHDVDTCRMLAEALLNNQICESDSALRGAGRVPGEPRAKASAGRYRRR